jgi:hypothetical protein
MLLTFPNLFQFSLLLSSSRVIRVGDCIRYVNSKAVNGRSVDEVMKDLVGDEGQSLEIAFRAADEAKSQVRCSLLQMRLRASVFYMSMKFPLDTHPTPRILSFRLCSSSVLQFLVAAAAAAAAAMAVAAASAEAKP